MQRVALQESLSPCPMVPGRVTWVCMCKWCEFMILQTTGIISQDTRSQFQICEPVLWVLNHYDTQKCPHALRWTTAWICLVQDLTVQTNRADSICCIQLFVLFLHQECHGATSALDLYSAMLGHSLGQHWNGTAMQEQNWLFYLFIVSFTVPILLNLPWFIEDWQTNDYCLLKESFS